MKTLQEYIDDLFIEQEYGGRHSGIFLPNFLNKETEERLLESEESDYPFPFYYDYQQSFIVMGWFWK